jgi:hypothetical protein
MDLGPRGRVVIVAAVSKGLGRGAASYISGTSVAIHGDAVRSLF